MKDFLEIGQIVTVHGIHGEVKVKPWCDSAEFLCEFDELFLSESCQKTAISGKLCYQILKKQERYFRE